MKKKLMTRKQSQLIHYDTLNTKYQRIASIFNSDEIAKATAAQELPPLHGRSLFCLGPNNSLRIMCHTLVENKWFTRIILVLICISTITLALETPLDDPEGDKLRVLGYIDLFMTVAFTFEAVVKIVAAGFAFTGKDSYIRDAWNILDFSIVLAALLGIIAGDAIEISFIKSLRIMKILRPLRAVNKIRGLKIAIMSLGGSIPSIVSLQIIVLFFVFLFAILQTTILSGQFYYCELNHTSVSQKQVD